MIVLTRRAQNGDKDLIERRRRQLLYPRHIAEQEQSGAPQTTFGVLNRIDHPCPVQHEEQCANRDAAVASGSAKAKLLSAHVSKQKPLHEPENTNICVRRSTALAAR